MAVFSGQAQHPVDPGGHLLTAEAAAEKAEADKKAAEEELAAKEKADAKAAMEVENARKVAKTLHGVLTARRSEPKRRGKSCRLPSVPFLTEGDQRMIRDRKGWPA